MTSLLEKLHARASASQARAKELRIQITALQEELTAEETRLSRWTVTAETVAALLAEEGASEEDVAVEAVVGEGTPAAVAAERPRAVVSAPVTRADGEVLSEANEDVVLALASAGRPLRSREICEALGLGTDHRRVEGMRTKLKRLVKYGWLAEEAVGLFSIAPGVGDARAGGDANRVAAEAVQEMAAEEA
ncbi:hypothetical protein ACFWY6_27575 [Streptomyces sp. NPDC059037]|uniref:hypothetical protein n=1 Tax=Streptomyces sp. NPDC059037 TaxID=3346710 RepID=UPI003693F68F